MFGDSNSIGLEGARPTPAKSNERRTKRCPNCKRKLPIFKRGEIPTPHEKEQRKLYSLPANDPVEHLNWDDWVYESEACRPCERQRQAEQREAERKQSQPDPNRTITQQAETVVMTRYQGNKIVERTLVVRDAKTGSVYSRRPLPVPK